MATLSKPDLVRPTAKDLGKDIGSIARTVYESVNLRDLDRATSVVAEDCEYIELGLGQIFRGPEGVRQNLSGWLAAFPDAQLEITNVVANGDMVAVEYTGRGTQTGPFVGPDGGTLAPTGRRIETSFCDVLKVRHGKIVRGRSYYDAASMMRQLGVLPERPTGTAKTVLKGPNEGTPLWMLGGLYTVKATAKETDGQLSVLEMVIPPGSGSPPHVHDCGESVFVIEGSIRWHVGDKDAVDAGPGQFLYFPKGTLEWAENVSASSAKLLVVYTPGGMDEFFAEAAEPAGKRELPPPPAAPPDFERLSSIAARHGLQLKAK